MNPLKAVLWDVPASWEVSGLILAVLLARGLLGRRIPARMWFIAWLTLALALLVPFRIRIPMRMDWLGIKTDAVVLKNYGAGTTVSYARAPFARIPPPILAAPPAAPKPAAPAVSRFSAASIPLWLWVWPGGMLGLAAIRLAATWSFRRKLRDAEPAPSRLQMIAVSEAERLGLRSSLALLVSPAVGEPVLFGLWRPRLVFPPRLIEKLSDEELRFILLHELGHCRRRDLAAHALLQTARIVHWFNPLVWLAVRVARADCELACDEFVLRRTQPEKRSDYGAALLAVLELTNGRARLPVGLTMLNGKRALTQRIRRIANYRNGSQASARVGALFLGLLVAVVVTQAAPSQPAAAKPAGAAAPVPQKSTIPGVTFMVTDLKTITAPPSKPPGRPPFADLNLPLSEVTHLALVVDTSGSMRDELTGKERQVVAGMFERLLLTVPHLQFFQLLDADGRVMLKGPPFEGPWIAAKPETLAAARAVLRDYDEKTVSNPTPGILQAYRGMRVFSEPQTRFGIWVLGDELSTSGSDQDVVHRLEQASPPTEPGRPRIALSVVNFIGRGPLGRGTFSQTRYTKLLQKFVRDSGGLFVNVVSTAADQGSSPPVVSAVARPMPGSIPSPAPTEGDVWVRSSRDYQRDLAAQRNRNARIEAELNQKIAGLDPAAAFDTLIAAAEQWAAEGQITFAVHLYNRAVQMRPPDQPLPESARKLRDTLRTQNTPPSTGADGREGGTR